MNFGDGVYIVARLEALAEPGSVLVSQGARSAAEDGVAAANRPRGGSMGWDYAEPAPLRRLDRRRRGSALGLAGVDQQFAAIAAGPALPESEGAAPASGRPLRLDPYEGAKRGRSGSSTGRPGLPGAAGRLWGWRGGESRMARTPRLERCRRRAPLRQGTGDYSARSLSGFRKNRPAAVLASISF
jgi:hypothetical protein